MNIHRIYIFILNVYKISNTALAYAVTIAEGDILQAAFEIKSLSILTIM